MENNKNYEWQHDAVRLDEVHCRTPKIWRNTSEHCLEGEVWRQCKDASDYEVSSLGRVRVMVNQFNKNGRHFWVGKIITQNRTSADKRYLKVNLKVDGELVGFSVHRLIARAFITGETEDRNQVNHKDGNPENNLPKNLEWVTAQENKDHAISTGLQWYPSGEDRPEAKLTEREVYGILTQYFLKQRLQSEIAVDFGMHKAYISLITRGLRWKKVFSKFVEEHVEQYTYLRDILNKRNGANRHKIDEIVKEAYCAT